MTNDQVLSARLGMLLVGHGTRDPRGVAEFFETAKLVAQLVPDVAVEAGFLELAAPSIGEAFERLASRDVGEVVVVPLLLFAAGHVKQDIPNELAAVATRFPRVTVGQAEPLGCHEKILAASAERFRRALPNGALLNGDTPLGELDPARDVAWVLVSRGTSDPAALAEVRSFVRLRRKVTPVASATIGFLAVAEPAVAAELEALARSSYSCVVVQPHLLFHGKLTSDLQALARRQRAESPRKQWLVAEHLGVCKQVAEAAVSRFWEARAEFV